MPELEESKAETGPRGRKRHRCLRRVLRWLAVVLALVVLVLAIVLYNPLRTLATLEKVDDYPLYVMHYKGTYFFDLFAEDGIEWGPWRRIYEAVNPDACTSFAAVEAGCGVVFGRNFDWQHRASPLLFTDPPGGYASVSMVDLYYLGLEGRQSIPWSERVALLGAPHAAIDGMNEYGVAMGKDYDQVHRFQLEMNALSIDLRPKGKLNE